jgi:hypothetical protein
LIWAKRNRRSRHTSLLLNRSLASQQLELVFHQLLRLVIRDLLVSRLHDWRIRLAFCAHLFVLLAQQLEIVTLVEECLQVLQRGLDALQPLVDTCTREWCDESIACVNSVTRLLQECLNCDRSPSRVLQGCCKSVARVFKQ